MIVLKATQEQYENINGHENGRDRLEFVKDGNGDWIIAARNINNSAFSEILGELLLLEKVEYVPPPIKNEDF